jgi:beta-glucosidase
LLPLAGAVLRAVAVIGVDAEEARLGGYSGPGVAPVSILDALRARLPAGAVRYAPGPGRTDEAYGVVPTANLRTPSGDAPGLRAEYFDNPRLEGEPRLVRTDERVDFLWTFNPPGRDIPRDWYSVRWTGTVTAPGGGLHRLGVEGKDGYRLWVDEVLVVDDWTKRSYGSHLATVDLEEGTTHRIRLEYFETTGNARVKLVWDAGVPTDGDARIAEAVEAAGEADAAVVVAGLEEGEFRDRAYLGLPGRQQELIRAVAATGTPVVVVIVGGSAVTMPWLDDVGAVLLAWYPGEQGGPAVADVLLGDASPAGRLPLTFPIAEGQLPLVYNHEPTGRGDDYVDLTGRPLFPFGYGLGYTGFAYSDLTIEPREMDPDGTTVVRLRVRNAGDRDGDEVVQLYVRDVLASVVRPVMELKGFTRIRLQAGEEREVVFTLTRTDLSVLDADLRRVVEPGVFRVLVGASSEDIRLRGEVRVR